MRSETVPAGSGAAMPFLSSRGDTVYLSWLEPDGDGGHRLRMSTRAAAGWSPARTVSHRTDFFVNWADFPSIQPGPDGALWSHWLQRGGSSTYDYGVRVSRSEDGGRSWSAPWTPHTDGTPTEHGFVSFVPDGQGMGLVWLDGRRFVAGPNSGPATEEMTLRYRRAEAGPSDAVEAPVHAAGPEVLLDERTCDCCQTDAVATPSGPVVVYRDRSPEEVRDIAVVRRTDGGWTDPVRVAPDGWTIPGCPVNGPSLVSRGDTLAVAWFSAADEEPRVRLAWSFDAGASFPVVREVSRTTPLGRVDLLMGDGGRVLVSWLEAGDDGAATVRLRSLGRQASDADTPAWTAATSSAGRGSGFPRLAWADGERSVLLAWTDVDPDGTRGLRVSRIEGMGS